MPAKPTPHSTLQNAPKSLPSATKYPRSTTQSLPHPTQSLPGTPKPIPLSTRSRPNARKLPSLARKRHPAAFRSPLVASVAVAALCLAGIAGARAHDHAVLRGRLVFADHQKPVVRILDLDSGAVTHSFEVPKPNASLTTLEGGRYVAVKTGDDSGTVRILDTGIVKDSHGDHDDIEKLAPRLLDLTFTGDRPAHVVSENGWLALFYDGQRPWERKSESKAVLIELKSLDGRKPAIDQWQSPAPQHGIAVPLGRGQWLMSQPNPAYARGDDKSASSRPNGFEVLQRGKQGDKRADKGWTLLASFNDPSKPAASCRLYHGHASLKNVHVLGCNEGDDGGMLVVARDKSGKWSARKLAYPDGRRTSTLKSRGGGRFMIGNYGLKTPYDALLRVDPAATALSPADLLQVPGGQSACQFDLSADGKRLANLTPDGKLRVYDIANWKELAAYDAVAPFDCGGEGPKPSLAIVGASAFIGDPVGKRIREFHLGTLKQGLDMPVDGMPTNIASGD